MSKKVSPIPRGFRSVTPCLTVDGIDDAIAFYQAAFEAELVSRHCAADEVTAVQATIKIGNSLIALHQQDPAQGILSPLALGASAGQIHLYVEHVDASWKLALYAGAQVRTEIHDAFWGERTGQLIDNNGHIWSIASKIENLTRAEISERAKLAQQEFTAAALALETLATQDQTLAA